MIKSSGADFVIIGHSERRQYFKETDETLAKKVNIALTNNLSPIFCCGEPLSIREKGEHQTYVSDQIEKGLFHLSEEDFSNVIIAYEPIWAIGTGVNATTEQAQEMHQSIRQFVQQKYGKTISENLSILYGGSCKASNAQELFACPDVDGGLIGGASLKSREFVDIAKSFPS
jgi:triosephosphate isomerase